jgi:hypothetical protein
MTTSAAAGAEQRLKDLHIILPMNRPCAGSEMTIS